MLIIVYYVFLEVRRHAVKYIIHVGYVACQSLLSEVFNNIYNTCLNMCIVHDLYLSQLIFV